jgi:hypothetical protein
MNCHAQVWNQSPYLDMVRKAYFSSQPIIWKKVHRLPDYVYFNHSIHVAKGVGCVTCHGRIDEMPEVRQEAPLTMGWCLDCHRDPQPNLRPHQYITSMIEKAPGQGTLPATHSESGLPTAQSPTAMNDVHTRTSCSTCHR